MHAGIVEDMGILKISARVQAREARETPRAMAKVRGERGHHHPHRLKATRAKVPREVMGRRRVRAKVKVHVGPAAAHIWLEIAPRRKVQARAIPIRVADTEKEEYERYIA